MLQLEGTSWRSNPQKEGPREQMVAPAEDSVQLTRVAKGPSGEEETQRPVRTYKGPKHWEGYHADLHIKLLIKKTMPSHNVSIRAHKVLVFFSRISNNLKGKNRVPLTCWPPTYTCLLCLGSNTEVQGREGFPHIGTCLKLEDIYSDSFSLIECQLYARCQA